MLTTILIKIEGMLNSKPLGYKLSDVANPDPVTPNLLLMGVARPLTTSGGVPKLESCLAIVTCQVLSNHFWVRFPRHYLSTLQTRFKWQSDMAPFWLGTLVMIIDPQLPRASWRVKSETIPMSDRCFFSSSVTDVMIYRRLFLCDKLLLWEEHCDSI